MSARPFRGSLALAALLPVAGGAAWAGEPFLVADVVQTTEGSNPDDFVEVDGRVYFGAQRPLSGRELWVSDGSAEGTRLVKDIHPGKGSSVPHDLTVFDGRVWFSAFHPLYGWELWVSDGSAQGTVLAADAYPGSEDGAPTGLTVFAGRLWFAASDPVHGRELWVSDGTADGTRLLKDLDPAIDSEPAALTVAGDRLYFVARTEAHGRELWVSDGTEEGTLLLWDATPGPSSGIGPAPRLLAAEGRRLYFEASHVSGGTLFVTDGSPEGTAPLDLSAVGDARFPLPVGVAGDRLLFTSGHPERPLWALEGSTVERLGDLRDVFASLPGAGGEVFFRATNDAYGAELWASDGTSAGTRLVVDVVPGAQSSAASPLAFEGGRLWFTTVVGRVRELWITASAGSATRLAAHDGFPRFLGGRMWFAGLDDAHGAEPWTSDGTLAGTGLVRDLNDTGTGSWEAMTHFAPLGRRLLIFAGEELWITDGSEAGTRQVPGPEGLDLGNPPGFSARLGGRVYFRGEEEATGVGIWWSDGERIELLAKVAPSRTSRRLLDLESTGRRLLYGTGDPREVSLWGSDGEDVVRLIHDENAGKFHSPQDEPVVDVEPLGDVALVFLGWRFADGTSRQTLWRTDGTPAGTRPIAEVSRFSSAATAVRDLLYFFQYGEPRELWASDGTVAGTRRVTALPPEIGAPPRDLVAVGNRLAFVVDSGLQGTRSWVSGGTAQGTRNLFPELTTVQHAAAGGRLYVETADDRNRRRLWQVDPVSLAVERVIDLGAPTALTAWGEVLYYTFENALWRTDGTPEGTVRLGEPAPHYLSFPRPDAAGSLLYFEGDDGIHGRELWAVAAECIESREVLCLGGGRFQARSHWRHPSGRAAGGTGARHGDASGTFSFFAPDRPEIAVKVLDGRAFNDHFWAFSGAGTHLEVDLHLFDVSTGSERRHFHPPGDLSSFAEVRAFADSEEEDAAVRDPAFAVSRPVSRTSRRGSPAPCAAGAETLCLLGERFEVTVGWRDPAGVRGPGAARRLSDVAGTFVFFGGDNLELMVKVLDGRAFNGRFWVYVASLTDVEVTMTVRDTATGAVRVYSSPRGRLGGFADAEAFGDG